MRAPLQPWAEVDFAHFGPEFRAVAVQAMAWAAMAVKGRALLERGEKRVVHVPLQAEEGA